MKNTDDQTLTIKLEDTADPDRASVDVTISGNPIGIEIGIAGFGEYTMEAGCGHPIYLEYYQGKLVLRVWGDINSEEPTHRIVLDGAREDQRRA